MKGIKMYPDAHRASRVEFPAIESGTANMQDNLAGDQEARPCAQRPGLRYGPSLLPGRGAPAAGGIGHVWNEWVRCLLVVKRP